MTRLTNLGNNSWDFTTGSKDGEPIIDSLLPGETKDIDLPADHPQITAVLNTTLVKLAGERTTRAASAAAASARKADDPSAS